MKILILLIIIFIIYIYITVVTVEPYINLNIYPSRLLFMHKFAKLHNGRIISLDIKPIEPSINESKCVKQLCPRMFADNMTCYQCS
jgi:hypothetical protein